jgi:hypothetical protein
LTFPVQNKSVVIRHKMCRLHLENHWTVVGHSKTQGAAELLLAVPDLEEKPNCMKLVAAVGSLSCTFTEEATPTRIKKPTHI